MSALSIVLEREEGALLRVLGTVERRGFRICDVQTQQLDPRLWQMDLIVQGNGSLQVLCRQLERLVDVRSASVCE